MPVKTTMKCPSRPTQVVKGHRLTQASVGKPVDLSTFSHHCGQQWETVQPCGDRQFHIKLKFIYPLTQKFHSRYLPRQKWNHISKRQKHRHKTNQTVSSIWLVITAKTRNNPNVPQQENEPMAVDSPTGNEEAQATNPPAAWANPTHAMPSWTQRNTYYMTPFKLNSRTGKAN